MSASPHTANTAAWDGQSMSHVLSRIKDEFQRKKRGGGAMQVSPCEAELVDSSGHRDDRAV